ncbi:MAG: hypothetical protein ACR2JY_09000 [Chloroflexota bacterium]
MVGCRDDRSLRGHAVTHRPRRHAMAGNVTGGAPVTAGPLGERERGSESWYPHQGSPCRPAVARQRARRRQRPDRSPTAGGGTTVTPPRPETTPRAATAAAGGVPAGPVNGPACVPVVDAGDWEAPGGG